MRMAFAPAVKLLDRLTYPRKFVLIALLFGLPLGMVTLFLVGELNERIAFSAKERLGTEYLRPVEKFAADLRERRGLTWARAGQQNAPEELRRIEELLRRDVQDIDAVDRRLGATLRTTPLWNEIKNQWLLLPGSGQEAAPVDSANRYTALIADLLALTSLAGDQSNLILDPDLDSYYLMEVTVNRLPLLTEQIGQARGLSTGLAGRESIAAMDQFQLRSLAAVIKSQREVLEHHFDVAFRETDDTQLADSLKPALNRSIADTNQFVDLIADTSGRASADEAWQQGSETLAGLEELYSLTSVALDRLLQARLSALFNRRLFVSAVICLCSLLVAYLFVAFYLAVMRTVAQLDDVSQRLVSGQPDDVAIRVDTRDELGQVARSFGALAARLKTECLTLRNHEQRMRAILEGAVDAVVTIDEQGRIESANSATERLFGYRASELTGKNVNMLMPDPYRSAHDGYLRRYLATGEKHVIGGGREVLGTRRDGTTFPADLTVSEVQLDDRRLFTGFVRDISARKRAEEALEAANAQLAGVLDAATQVSIISTDLNGLITVFNSGAENLLGYSADEMIGKQTPWIIHLQEEVVARGQELSRELGDRIDGFEVFVAYAKRGRFDRREWTYVRKDGSPLTVSLVVTVVKNADGEITGYLGVAEDITLRKQTERHLLAARRSAEQAAQAKGDFLANMSHEIRTPMNGIIGMIELALDTSLTSEQREYLEVVNSSAHSLLRIINDILDFSKIEAGKLELDPHPFRLRETLGDTMRTLAIRAHEKSLELLWHTAPDVPDGLIGDAGRLRQILVNLCGNAIKFTEHGEVGVSVNLASRTESATRLRFSVRDTGIGIPKDKQALVFEAFSQADASTTRAFGGTGLGLSISRQLVRMMGGDLSLDSEERRGSTFFFEIELPLTPVSADDSESDSPVDLSGVRVLVVDDNETNRRILEELLTGWMMQTTLADSGPAALEEMRRAASNGQPFDLVLTDYHMPQMDGFMFIEELKKHPELARSMIMMLTSADRQGAHERCRQLGVAATLLKPLKQSELRQTICKTLSRFDRPERKPAPLPDSALPASSPRLRILLAEDNQINQQVAIRFLNKLGHEVQTVENGQRALDALQMSAFDVVLMDVQMPVLDGFKAVAAIREREKATGRHQPVVAMTAHAIAGDRERCLDAGMDDYVSKPVSSATLAAVLSRVAERTDSAVFAQVPNSTSTSPEPLEPLAFDVEAALANLNGEREFLTELAGLFLHSIPELLQTLAAAIERLDANAAADAAHAIKGSLGIFCAEPAYAATLQLERDCRAGSVENMSSSHQCVVREICRLTDALRQEMASNA
ncbi:MAG: PAS domain S-box protein [Planctomycetaceae bacterium]|nr:PAS domain S-box protein [Planctomycetaceae bacterium]